MGHSNLSKSERYLNRIQQETDRLRKKRKDRRESGELSVASDFDVDDDHHDRSRTETRRPIGSAAEAVASSLIVKQQQQQLSRKPTDTTVNVSLVSKSFDSTLSS